MKRVSLKNKSIYAIFDFYRDGKISKADAVNEIKCRYDNLEKQTNRKLQKKRV
jgi:hypothetical protein